MGDDMVKDPVQVAADAGEHGRESHLTSHRGSKRGGSDQVAGVALLVDQRTARVTMAGGLAAGGAHADHLLRHSSTPVHPAQGVRHNGHLHVSQHGGNRVGGIAFPPPAGGEGPDGLVRGKLAIQATGQTGGPDAISETHKGGQSNKRDVVDHRAGHIVRVHYNTRLLHHDPFLTLLGLITDVYGPQIDRYGLRPIHAVCCCDYPVV